MNPEQFDLLSWAEKEAELMRAASLASAEKYAQEKKERKDARKRRRMAFVVQSAPMEMEGEE